MEKKLLLLGMLRSEGQFCPYLMSDDLEGFSRVGLGVRKANAHRLISDMIKLGWINQHPNGSSENYELTEAGITAFDNLQRSRLATFVMPEIPNAIALNHLLLMTIKMLSMAL